MAQNRFWQLLAKKLACEISPAELRELEQLMRAHPDWINSAETIEALWQQRRKHENHLDAELGFEQHLDKLMARGISFPELQPAALPQPADAEFSQERKRSPGKMLLLSFLCAGLIFLTIFFVSRQDRNPLSEASGNISEITTNPGSRTRLILPDSSVVWLNAGSRLTYNKDFGSAHRTATLEGEGFFEVRKSKIPFIINTGGVHIKVLGTVFNVKSYLTDRTTETSLLQGRVEITIDRRPGEKFILNPNEKLVVANDPGIKNLNKVREVQEKEMLVQLSHLSRTEDSTIVETSWVDNKLIFQNESFSELAERMERWYGVAIEFRDEDVAHQRLSGTFTTETIQEAIEELQYTTRFKYSIKSNQVIITKQ